MYDLIIVGAGPAGMTAAVYAARKRMNALLLWSENVYEEENECTPR